MKPIHSAALLVVLTACSANKSAPPSAPPSSASPEAMAPKTEAPAPAAPAAVGGASPDDKGAPGAGSVPQAAPRAATSPVADPSQGGAPSAGPSRLEDVKTTKNTTTGGTYQVKVTSAAGLVPDEVGKSVNAAASKTDACYSQALKKKVPAGAIVYELNVNAQGTAAVKTTSDTIKDAPLNKCIEDTLKKIAWPKPTEKAGGKTTIEFAVTG